MSTPRTPLVATWRTDPETSIAADTNLDRESPPRSPPDATRARATSRELVDSIAGHDLEALRPHRLELALSIIELADDAGRPFPWSHDDPVVALLRAASRLALLSPDATSASAAHLAERLDRIAGHDGRAS